jgi:hypothetical protein
MPNTILFMRTSVEQSILFKEVHERSLDSTKFASERTLVQMQHLNSISK